MEAIDELERGREAYAARAWADATEALTAADAQHPIGPGDLELLAIALYMIGREQQHLATLERAHRGHLQAGVTRRAAYCAFWIGMQLFMRGEVGRGGGWLGRVHRLLEHEDDCVEHGYLLLPEMYRKNAAGDLGGAVDVAAAAAEVGRRFADADLLALATYGQGQFLVSGGRLTEGLRLLDEAMLAVTAGEVSPIATGIIYCGAIDGCQTAFDPRRAQEWTAALHAWCELQPDMLAFSGTCHVHRAEMMQLHGAWADALEELGRAAQRAARAGNLRVAAHAAYCRGEILRLRGELAGAEDAYREAARGGHEPQPGLALLRLGNGDAGAAVAAIRRVLSETSDPAQRAVRLRAGAEIMLAAGDADAAREACVELESIAADRASDMLAAIVAQTRGAVELGSGDARGALPFLRRALAGWNDLRAPYEAARVRLLIAQACKTLGDEDSAALDLDAAREALETLGAAPDSERPPEAHGLTGRELQVLRHVASGATNKAIAAELVLSERTVDRHVSNIFTKLRVSSRAAATAYAYEHRLL